MMKEAESHAEEDKARREEIETRNNADQLVWQTEKLLEEQGEKVNDEEKSKINESLKALKDVLANESSPVEDIKTKHDELIKASQEFAQRIYAAAQAEGMSDVDADNVGDFSGPESSDDVAEAEVVDDSISEDAVSDSVDADSVDDATEVKDA